MKKFLLIIGLILLKTALYAAVGDEFTIDGITYVQTAAAPELTSKVKEGTSVSSPGNSTFSGALNIPSQVYNPKNGKFLTVTEIGDYAFSNNLNITSLTLPESLVTIGNLAFYNCKNITGSLTIPEGVIKVESSAFSGCSGFTGDLIIPESVTSIEDSAFKGCSSFQKIYSFALTPPSLGSTAFETSLYSNAKLIVPKESVALYQANYDWNKFIQILAYLPPVEKISLSSVSQEKISNKTNLKDTEELYFTVIFEPEESDFERINWSAEPAYITFSDTGNGNGTLVCAKVMEGVIAGNVVITATVDDTDVKATYEVSISQLIPGDANDSGEVNVVDVGIVTSKILKMPQNENFCFVQADVNADKEIDVSDQATVQNIALGREAFAATRSGYSEDFGRLIAYNNSKQNAIEISLENASSYVILQADILIPEGMEIEGVRLGEQAQQHELRYRMIEEDVLRVVVYSMNNESFNDVNGRLFIMETGSSTALDAVILDNIIAADNHGNRHELGFGIGEVNSEAGVVLPEYKTEEGMEVYNLHGHRINLTENLNPGIYIVNGKKIMVK